MFNLNFEIFSLCSWEDIVTHHFSLDLRKKNIEVVLPDGPAVERLRNIPKTWTIEHDEALVRLMSKHLSPENEQLGSIKNYVESIDVSSFIVSNKFIIAPLENLTVTQNL